MSRYVVAMKNEPPTFSLVGAVSDVPGVEVMGAASAMRVVIEAGPSAIGELQRRFGNLVIVEPEIRHERLRSFQTA